MIKHIKNHQYFTGDVSTENLKILINNLWDTNKFKISHFYSSNLVHYIQYKGKNYINPNSIEKALL